MATIAFRPDWEKNGRVKKLIEVLNAGTLPNDAGIQFVDHDFRQYFDLLTSSFRCPSDLTWSEINGIVCRAFIDLRKSGEVTSSALRSRVNAAASSALAESLQPFTMWTRLRLRDMNHCSGFKLRFDNVALEGVARLPKKFLLKDYFISGIGNIYPNTSSGFGYLILRTSARNEDDAARKIFDAADTFFAMSNLLWRGWSLWTDRHAQAELWLGRYQFFWKGRNFLGQDKIWYNADFNEEKWSRFPKKGSEFIKILPHVRGHMRYLERHPLRDVLSKTAKLLHEGMASPDLSYRLLRYWSALESLFSDGEARNVSYGKVIQRAVFAAKDRELSIIKLDYLSKLRNGYVHEGQSEQDKSELIQFLRDVVAYPLMYLIKNAQDISDHREFLEMTDIPADEGAISRLRRALARADNIKLTGKHI